MIHPWQIVCLFLNSVVTDAASRPPAMVDFYSYNEMLMKFGEFCIS